METNRIISPGAEKWLNRPIQCLDHGFVRLVDYMGADEAIVQAARVSYGQGTKKIQEDRGLIRYLLRNRHTTPFEMCEFKFHVKVPMDCWRQWIRHRTANVNEYSTRYSIAINETQETSSDAWRSQAEDNKQGSGAFLDSSVGGKFSVQEKEFHDLGRRIYDERVEAGIAREQARKDLPLSTYTEAYWKIDLHNLLHFLGLRLDPHAQLEIRTYAEAMATIVKDAVPMTFEAFEDYERHALRLSRPEIGFVTSHTWPMAEEEAARLVFESFKNKRETEEFLKKLKRLRLIA
jgi:thymidylate synthase (FAD)